MERFDFEEILKPVLRMIAYIGTWPKRNPSIPYRMRGWFAVISTILLTSSCVVEIITNFSDISDVIYAMCIALAVFHATVKHTVLNINKEQMFQVLYFLKDPIFTNHGPLNTYISRKMRTCSFGRRLFIFSSWCTATSIIISPVFGISSRMPATPFPIDLKDKPIYWFLFVWFIQAVAVVSTAWIISSYDGLIVYLMGIAAVQIKILRENIIHSTDGFIQDIENFDKLVNKKLRKCVIHHIKIERFIQAMEDMLMYSFLIQLLISLIITVFVGFNVIITPVTSPNFGRSLFFFVAVVIELTNFCIPGNEIILQSEKIRDACYMSEWTKCGPSVRRTLFIIMERSKRPLNLTAAKFVVLSLSSLLSVLKSSFSYFTVLRQVYSEPNKM